jgi:hypothetical protein
MQGSLGANSRNGNIPLALPFGTTVFITLLSVIIAAIVASYLVDSAIVNWRMIDISIIAFGGIGVLTGIAKGSSIEPKNLFELIQDSPHAPLRSAILWQNHNFPEILEQANYYGQ